MIRLPRSEISGTHEPGSTNRKPRGSGFDREILRRGVAQGKSPEQLSEELGTSSIRSVRNAMTRLRKENGGKSPAILPRGDVFPTGKGPCDKGNNHTSVWFNVPIYAPAETFELLKIFASDDVWASQFQWFGNSRRRELYIYNDTDISLLKTWLIRNGFVLHLVFEKVAPREKLQEVSINVIPSNPSKRVNEEEWRKPLFQVDYGAFLEDLRICLKDFIINAKVRITGSGREASVYFDPEEMQCIGESINEAGYYFALVQDPLASVKYGHCRIVFIHNEEMVLIDNMNNQELMDLHSKILWGDDFRYLGNGKYERIGKERLFRQKGGYWVGRLPRNSLEEAKELLRPITAPSLYSEYTGILGGFAREHEIELYSSGKPIT